MLTALTASAAVTIFVIFAGRTRWGRAMRAFGDQPWFTSSLGLSPNAMAFGGLGIANALVGAGGVLVCHFRHVCDINMNVGVLVSGLAAVMIGEAVFNAKRMWQHALSAVCGTILYNMAVGLLYFDWGLGLEKFFVANDVRLVSGLMLLFPAALVARKRRRYRLFASEW
jgi:putative ABC transport system permease protein